MKGGIDMFKPMNIIDTEQKIFDRCEDICRFCDVPDDYCKQCDSKDWCIIKDY